MTNLNTVTEATNLFETYFPSGLRYNKDLTQITAPRVADPKTGKIGETMSMRLGEQLQFLGALHDKTPDTNPAKQGRIHAEITSVLDALEKYGYLGWTASEDANYLNESFLIMGLSIIKGGTTYSKLSLANKQRIDKALPSLVSKARTTLANAIDTSNPTAPWRNTVATNYKEIGTNRIIKVPLMSLNSTSILIGALGMYENLVGKSTNSTDIMIKIADIVRGFENTISGQPGSYFTIGGGRVIARRLFGSSGYNAVVGQALFLAYRGFSQKPFTEEASTTNKYHNTAKGIATYYEYLMDTTSVRLDEMHTSTGVPVTEAMVQEAMASADPDNFLADTDAVEAQKRYNETIALIVSPERMSHAQSSAYLYSLAWGAPVEFMQKLDKHVIKTKEANPNLAGVSAMRALMNNSGFSTSHVATSGRVLTGFAAMMMRGIEYVTDGK